MDKKPIPMPGPRRRFDTVVLADGLYPTAPEPAGLLAAAARVVCCDGAADAFIARGGVPYAIVGDCDSVGEAALARFPHLLHRDPDQETNDLTKAVDFCLSQGFDRIAVLGATGKREDHTIGNIGLLADYAARAQDVCIATDYGVFDAIGTDTRFESFPGQQVSLFALDPAARVGVRDLRYTPPASGMRSWWQGTLNESLAEVFSVVTSCRTIVFRTYR